MRRLFIYLVYHYISGRIGENVDITALLEQKRRQETRKGTGRNIDKVIVIHSATEPEVPIKLLSELRDAVTELKTDNSGTIKFLL